MFVAQSWAKMAEDQEGVDDMVELAEISEKAIAANLYVRLKRETIYVSSIAFTIRLSTWIIGSNSYSYSKINRWQIRLP